MKMIRFFLADGTQREMTQAEANALSMEGMVEALNGKAIINVEFYSERDT